MRPAAVAVVSLVSAAVGGIAVLLVGAALGWVGERGGGASVVEIREIAGGDVPVARPVTGNGFDPAAVYAASSPGVVTVYALFSTHPDGGASQGSGFVVSSQGYVLTNSHVITNAGGDTAGSDAQAAEQVFVEFQDGERVPAKVVGFDLFDDVGVLRVEPGRHRLVPLPLGNSAAVVVGEPVAAIGSPFGAENSLAVGVVSATERSISALTSDYRLVDAIQIDAPINRGNSGGPLLDARGRVIGINAQIRSSSGNAEGVGFAVPINSAKRSLEQLIETGRVEYAYVGISTDNLTPALARRLGYPVSYGAVIVDVTGAPARAAKLRGGDEAVVLSGEEVTIGGDVVIEIAGRPVRSGDDLVRIVTHTLRPGERVTFTIIRDGKRMRVPVTLGERPLDPAR
jgi:S1-C subfamily serine protease